MFVFKMQSVLDAKKNREEKALTEFQECSRLLEKEKENLTTMVRERDLLLAELRLGKNRTTSAGDIDLVISYIKIWEHRITQQQMVITNLTGEVEKKRQFLMDIMKDRKILENLKEQHLEDYSAQRNVEERLAADETAILRHGRKWL